MDIYFIILVDFHVLEGKCKNFIDGILVFYDAPGCSGTEEKQLGDQAHKKGS